MNLNLDKRNPEAFLAFRDVVERFGERAGFAERYTAECVDVAPELHALRGDLFNPSSSVSLPDAEAEPLANVVSLVAVDRAHEVRAVAKEIKKLALDQGYAPHEIAVVSRSRDRYESLVRDTFRAEGIAVSLGERRRLTDLPSARAAMKLLDAAVSNRSRSGRQIRIERLVGLLKSDFFRVDVSDAKATGQAILPFDRPDDTDATNAISPDDVENAAAFVGSELNLDDWLRRAHRLIARLSGS